MNTHKNKSSRTSCSGFTLIELLVVISVAALLYQIAAANLGAMIPSTILDREATLLVAKYDFLRSEARLNGKTYTLELDLTNSRYQTLMPIEERREASEVEKESLGLGWTKLPDGAKLIGYSIAGGQMLKSGLVPVHFDENGFAADQTLFLSLEQDDRMIWSVQIRGLTGHSNILKDFDGKLQSLPKIEEAAF